MTTERIIRSDGWLYRLAYLDVKEEHRPKDTVNLCQVVFMAAFTSFTFIILGAACTLAAAVGFCIAAGLLAGLGWVLYEVPSWLMLLISNMHHVRRPEAPTQLWPSLTVVFGFLAAMIALYYFSTAKKEAVSETVHLLAAYLRAKKENICPIYKIV